MDPFAADLTARILRHERVLLSAAVLVLALLAWAYLLRDAPMAMEPPLAALVTMWSIMMVAMMLPSATPALLLYSRVRQARVNDPAIADTWVMLAGYIIAWLIFAAAVAYLQTAFAVPSMAIQNAGAKGAVLIVAGLYQLSPFKSACLAQCRSPGLFISRHWRAGLAGAIRLGLLHGFYCVGCCWMLMALLFVGGVMNLAWVVALTILVAAEKLIPAGLWVQRVSGVVIVAWGLLTILQ